MEQKMKFNGEQAIVFERERNHNMVVCSTDDYFKSTQAVFEAINFICQKKCPFKFELFVELFVDPYLINEGDISDLSYDFLEFYCESDPHLKVVWVETDDDRSLTIMMTTV